MAICDFDMRFTYASIGQPGAMHDTSVLYHAIRVDKEIFPHPPKGKDFEQTRQLHIFLSNVLSYQVNFFVFFFRQVLPS